MLKRLLVVLCLSSIGNSSDISTDISSAIADLGSILSYVKDVLEGTGELMLSVLAPENPDPMDYNLVELSQAVKSFVEKLYSNLTAPVDLVTFGSQEHLFNRVIKNVITHSIKDIAFRVIEYKDIEDKNCAVKNPSIFFINSVVSCTDFVRRPLTNSAEQQRLQFFVFCFSARKQHIIDLIFKDDRFLDMSFLVFEDGRFKLFNFRDENLHKRGKNSSSRMKRLEEVNTFSKSLSRWNTDKFFPEPRTNFDGLLIYFAIEGYTGSQKIENVTGGIKCKGSNIEILEEIARTLDFKLRCYPQRDGVMLKEIRTHYILLHYKPISRIERDFFMLPTYESSRIVYLVPPGETYSAYEKLVLAFDDETWAWIVVTFAVAYLTIFVAGFGPKWLKGMIFGSHVNTPSLNVIVAFFGLGQMTLPKRNFARFLLMSFILYSLIIRTAYQGVSFELLQSGVQKKGIQSIYEAVDKGFNFYAVTDVFLYTSETADELRFIKKYYDDKLGNRSTEDMMPFDNIITNATSNAVAVVPEAYLKELNSQFNGTVALNVLPETFNSVPMVMMLPKDCFIFKPLNRVLSRFIEAGIVNRIVRDYNEKQRIPTNEEVGPQILTMETLRASFEVWICSVVVSIIAFAIELFYFHRMKIVKLFLTFLRRIYEKAVKEVVTIKANVVAQRSVRVQPKSTPVLELEVSEGREPIILELLKPETESEPKPDPSQCITGP